MIYAFCFLGEFGYEVFNWQGLVRKFASTISENDKIVICGRNGMDIWYPFADKFIDISELPRFKNSMAVMYYAYESDKYSEDYEDLLKVDIDEYVTARLEDDGIDTGSIRFIFSCDQNYLNKVKFGPWPDTLDIYSGDLTERNDYQKLPPAENSYRDPIEEKLGFSLSQPYILVQKRQRDVLNRSQKSIDDNSIIEKLKNLAPVVLLDFNTGRNNDSGSTFENIAGVHRYGCGSAKEQSVLIANANACVFLTEGDFGSHIYVPPFMGKDVYAIAPADIYEVGTTPIDFWNGSVFHFDGKIIPFTNEELLKDNYAAFANYLDSVIGVNLFFQQVEDAGKTAKFDDVYLWPRTPRTPNHQHKIIERVGVSDFELDNPHSRPNSICRHINKLISSGKLAKQFTLADLCGGDAVVCSCIKKMFPKSEIIVQDCLKGEFDTHKLAEKMGVKLYGGYLQDIIKNGLEKPIDIVMLLNTYRGWISADLHENEQDLPQLVDQWLERNARFVIVTATMKQIYGLKESGHKVGIIGKGEDDSHMLCIDNSGE